MRNELMIDIETTGQSVWCKVLSIGCFGFDKDGQQCEFYRRFSTEEQAAEGLIDDQATLDWWARQSEEARKEAFGGTTGPADGISDFKKFFYKNFSTGKYDGFRVWCNGLDFDFPILKEFFKRFGFGFPWMFWTQYDYRTIKNCFNGVKEAEGNVAAHNALEDAKAQMRGLRMFYKTMNEKF